MIHRRTLRGVPHRHVWACALLISLFLIPFSSRGSEIDLLSRGNEGTVNGALFQQGSTGAGSGAFIQFYRLQGKGSQRGYNSSGRREFDTKNGAIDLQLSQMTVTTIHGTEYLSFGLDLNEHSSSPAKYISLDTVEIYVSETGGNTGYSHPGSVGGTGGLGTLIYDMDAGEDSTVFLDYSLESGSGWSDMWLHVPADRLTGRDTDDYVYVYSEFGGYAGSYNGIGDWASEAAGFEEWSWNSGANTALVPEPGAFSLLVLALGAAAGIRRPRKSA